MSRMWKDYSAEYIKNNRASSLSAAASALIAALLLSLLGTLFYNLWQDEVRRIVAEEGDWQARITAELGEEELALLRGFANVERAEPNAALSEGGKVTVELWFANPRTIFRDLPLLLDRLGLEPSAAECHTLLLSRWLIHDPQDESPPLLVSYYLAVLAVVSASLALIIHNSFALSMNTRVQQFGVFSSVGATPGQIWLCLMQEAATLCAGPVLLGSGLGAALCWGVLRAVGAWAAHAAIRQEIEFAYSPLLFAGTAALAGLTVLLSACLPAWRLSRCTPMEAVRGTDGIPPKKKRSAPVLSALFGIEGELAGGALRAQSRALRTSTLSLTLSFLGFTTMLCFFTLSDISTEHTYFERYQDAWDVMATVRDTPLEEFRPAEALDGLPGAEDVVLYQRAQAECVLPQEQQSPALLALGGLPALTGEEGTAVQVDLVILDDAGFMAYCQACGLAVQPTGAVAVNRIWDSLHSGFRYKTYLPYLREGTKTLTLRPAGQTDGGLALPLLACTEQEPALREAYRDYALVLVLPLSVWEQAGSLLGGAQADTCIRILAAEGAGPEALDALEEEAARRVGTGYTLEWENRLRERQTNDELLRGYKMVLGGLCALLALIGLANVFCNTLGFLTLRRREFAQYLSVGMTPRELKKLFCIEALAIAGRPVLVTLPLAGAAVAWMIAASDLNPAEFWARAPVLPAAGFALAILGFVALAYWLGGRRVLRCTLAEALRDGRAR